MSGHRLRAILVAGPTATGKSAFALRLAEQFGSTIVNADSQQVYREWRILTDRPTAADIRRARHLLYGHVSAWDSYSVGRWLEDIGPVLAGSSRDAAPPVIVGGTGAYFTALVRGLAPVPRTSPQTREHVAEWIRECGFTRAMDELRRRDPDTAATIDLRNPRRVARAWEVLHQTGRGLQAWHAMTAPPLLAVAEAETVILAQPPGRLRSGIAERFERMVAEGAVEEVRSVLEEVARRGGKPVMPHGAKELAAYLAGEIDRETAMERAVTVTRQYAKRQATWFRNQMPTWNVVAPEEVEQVVRRIETRLGER